MKAFIKTTLLKLGYEVRRKPPATAAVLLARPELPDDAFYAPLFSPWLGYGAFRHVWELAQPHTLVSADRCYVLYTLARQALALPGDFWECGVYKGGTARLLADVLAANATTSATLHLFDTFTGMPETDPLRDLHQRGDFADTSLTAVQEHVGHAHLVTYHQGVIPATFQGLDRARIAFAHVDVDIYQSIWDCCAFIMPRLVPGGFLVFDDYGFPTCPGARQAVDDFFRDRPEQPLVLPTGQALVFALA
jgi:O-methyltransferase